VVGSEQPRISKRAAWREFPGGEIANTRRTSLAIASGYWYTIFWRKSALSPGRPNNADAFGLRAVSVVLTASRGKKG